MRREGEQAAAWCWHVCQCWEGNTALPAGWKHLGSAPALLAKTASSLSFGLLIQGGVRDRV